MEMKAMPASSLYSWIAADVAMADLARQADLREEAPRRLGVLGQLGAQHLEGDRLLEHAVEGLVDAPHAAAADVASHLVAPGEHELARERVEGATAGEARAGAGLVLSLARGTAHHQRATRGSRPSASA
jgi:hypothetical protein